MSLQTQTLHTHESEADVQHPLQAHIRPWSYSNIRVFLDTRSHCAVLAPPDSFPSGLTFSRITNCPGIRKASRWETRRLDFCTDLLCGLRHLCHSFLSPKPGICCQAYKHMLFLIQSSQQRIQDICGDYSSEDTDKSNRAAASASFFPFPSTSLCSEVKIYRLNIWKWPKCLLLRYRVQIESGLSLRMSLRNLTALRKNKVKMPQSPTSFPQPARQS